MKDLYLIENSTVLKNLLGITDEKELDLAQQKTEGATHRKQKQPLDNDCQVVYNIVKR